MGQDSNLEPSGEPGEPDYGRLDVLYAQASKLPPQDREAWLDRHCIDPALRSQVIEMLEADSSGQKTGLARSGEAGAVGAGVAGVAPGSRVGPYTIVSALGEGGMGAVFLAERSDGQFSQRVAVKLLRSALPGSRQLERFLHERQILAGLNHPNIARLLDGGTTESGLPFLAMEHVIGAPIDGWCRDQGLSVTARLHLVQKVCAAVQAAHQSLVVHRDIKPANILVDGQGEPKLLDFGIAKLLDEDGPAPETRFGERLLTPEFASPEQVRGDTVTTATDVYSLGVLLYLILTGHSPYARWANRPLELQQAICSTDPAPPSKTLSPTDAEALVALPYATLRRELRGDLDHIVLKAMRKEPTERYVSPAALGEDIQRYLQREPIAARQGSWRYRAGKYLRRNAVALLITAVIVLGIASLTGFYTTRLAAERDAAEAARAIAEQERSAAEQSADFMASLFTAAGPNQARPDLLARDLLRAGAERVEQELADQPRIEARLQASIGEAYWALGLFEEGESRIRRALELMRLHPPSDSALPGLILRRFAGELVEHERYDEAMAHFHEAEAILRQALGPDHIEVAMILQDIDQIHSNRDHDISDARGQRFDEIERIYRVNGLEKTRDFALLFDLRSAWHKQRFEWAQAIEQSTASIQLQTQLGPRRHPSVIFTIEDHARLRYFAGDYSAAAPLFEEVVSVIEEFKGKEHVDMAWSLYYRARIARERGQPATARQLFERLIAMEQATPFTPDRRYLARALCGLALVQADAGEHDAARESCERGREILTATQQKRIQMDVVHEGAGIAALARGDIATGLRELQALAAVRRLEHDPAQTDTPAAIGLHGVAEAAAGNSLQARALYDEAIALARLRYGQGYPTLGRVLWARARLHEDMGEHGAAVEDRRLARDIFAAQRLAPQSAAWTIPGGSGP